MSARGLVYGYSGGVGERGALARCVLRELLMRYQDGQVKAQGGDVPREFFLRFLDEMHTRGSRCWVA